MRVQAVRPHLELISPLVGAVTPSSAESLRAQPAARAVRVVALARLASATRGYEQLLAGHPHGLHDLRVALRRLRSLLKAYRPLAAGTLKRKTLRSLRSLARATSEPRDAEVASAWLAHQTEVPARARAGVREATQRFEAARDAALESVGARLKRDFPSLVTRLTRQLAIPAESDTVVPPVVSPAFEDAAAAVIHKHKARLVLALARVKTIADVDAAHAARIAAKRLRYVLEPLHEGSAYAPLERLVELQDALGAARDAQQMTQRFVREIGKRAARDARTRARVAIGVQRKRGAGGAFTRLRPGLLELARRARLEERRAFATFRKGWGKEAALILAEIP